MKGKTKQNRRPRKMKKFRSQILAYWLTEMYEPCKAADIGGGKGLVTYLLNKAGWQSTVIDPEYQELPTKYRELDKTRVKIEEEEKVPHINKPFTPEMAENFDLLIGLHAHGVMRYIIEASAKYNKDFIILPCCVIDEPIVKQRDINWRESLFDYANELGLPVKKVQFNFMGKNIALYTNRNLKKKELQAEDLHRYLIDPIRDELCEK